MKDKHFILIVMSFIFGGIVNELIEQVFGDIFHISTLPQRVLIIGSIFITVIIIAYILSMSRKIDNSLEKLTLKLIDEIPCSFIKDKKDRLEKMTNYINLAKKQILIFSDLSEKRSTQNYEHKKYLSALNKKIKKRQIGFQRIIVPNYDMNKYEDDEITKRIKGHPTYKKHFENVRKYYPEALLLEKEGIRGINIMLIDEKYLFLIIMKEYQDKTLANILEGGLFFEDSNNNLAGRFVEFFNSRKGRVVMD